MHAADDRRHMMLARAFQPDVAQQDDFVVAVGFLERAFEQGDGVDGITDEELLIGTGDARGGITQAFAVRVIAGPAQQDADRGFGLFARRRVFRGHVGRSRR